MRQDEIHKLESQYKMNTLTVSYPTQKGDNGIMSLSFFYARNDGTYLHNIIKYSRNL